jgi:hypothetical protein
VLALQWRGIFVVVVILADVIFFSTVFLQFDGTTQKNETNTDHTMEWLVCMLRHDGQKNLCLEQASKLVVSEGTAFSVLFLLSVCSVRRRRPPLCRIRSVLTPSRSSTASGRSSCSDSPASTPPGSP